MSTGKLVLVRKKKFNGLAVGMDVFINDKPFGKMASGEKKEFDLEPGTYKIKVHSDKYSAEVKADIEEAKNIGVRGVPFFVMNRAYAVSGAKPVEVFTETLQKSFEGWKK